eukprot:jgi/Undpi1/13565/HiC_scaffold_8.g03224.m1
MTSLVDMLGSCVAVDDAGSDGGIVEVDGPCEDGACAFGARGVPAPATPEGASGMHISGGATDDDYCTSTTPTRGSGRTSDGGVINVDDVSEIGGLAFGARGSLLRRLRERLSSVWLPVPAAVVRRRLRGMHYSYSAEALGAELKSIPMEGKNLEDVETAVKQTCATHGVKIARDSSKREKGEGGRLVMIAWKCVHGMQIGRTTGRANVRGVPLVTLSHRTDCAFKITARWPFICPVNNHPRLTTMSPEHQHTVEKEAMEIKDQMKAPLSSPMKAAAVKLTDAELASAVQAKVLKALHNRRVNTRAVQNAASQHSGAEKLFDAQEALDKVREATKGGGVSKVKLDRHGRFTHLVWMTAGQVRRVCNARTSLVRLFGFLDGAIEQQSDRSALRNAQLHMPTMFLPRTAFVWFGDELLKPLKFGLGVWPVNFMLEEIDAASLFCGGSGNHVVDGPDRAESLGKLEYLGDMVVDVETVACNVENRGGTDMRYLVLAMKGGSHLCSCRTLQTLGLCCRHFLDDDVS